MLVGLIGPSSSGKTLSALRMASGMVSGTNKRTTLIDTENGRCLHYADRFDFDRIALDAPYSPERYCEAVGLALDASPGALVIDQASFEHNGEGGVLDQAESFLEAKCGDDWKKRDKLKMVSFAKPKQQRRKLNLLLERASNTCPIIVCYRGADKIKPETGKGVVQMGLQPETTSPLIFEMSAQLLLPAGCNGVPKLYSDNPYECKHIKVPDYLAHIFPDGEQLTEETGARLAEWARGDTIRRFDEARDLIESVATLDDLRAVWNDVNKRKREFSAAEFAKLAEMKDQRKGELS